MTFRHKRSHIFLRILSIILLRSDILKQYPEYNEDIKSVICKNVKKYRNIKGISLADLAEKLDVSVDHLKRIEAPNDRNNISLVTLYKISIILGVRIDKFFEIDG